MNKDAEVEIERLASMLSFTITPEVTPAGAVLSFSQNNVADLARAAMSWAFDYAAQHCDAQKVVWEGTGVDPAHVLNMVADNLRGLAKA